jgi:hypothetical protein
MLKYGNGARGTVALPPVAPPLGIRHRVMRFDPNTPNCRVKQLDSYFHIYSSIVEAEAPLSDDT